MLPLPEPSLSQDYEQQPKRSLYLSSLSMLGFARQASLVVPFENAFRSEPILISLFHCIAELLFNAFTGAVVHADSECFLMRI